MDNSFFPIRFEMHIILALLAVLVFGLQFIRYRKAHHLILALALPCTLLPYLSDSPTLFNAVGIGEAAALAIAFILSQTLDRDKEAVPAEGEEAEEEAEDAEDSGE